MFKRKEKGWGKLPPEGFSAEDFVKTATAQDEFVKKVQVADEPTIVDGFEDELKRIEELIHTREDEIRDLNVRAVELSSQIAWLKRTPQAVTILTALKKRYTGV